MTEAPEPKTAPLDLNALVESHQFRVSVESVEHPADARLRRVKDFLLFLVVLLGVVAIAGYCLWLLVSRPDDLVDGKWATALLTSMVSAALGYLTGRS